ncbi:hypothetical protein FE394_02810 [Xenorhabdus sp. Reich]|uniref:Uncharacterized protein n=1 Tax=Xenorhabdus littoralis TaxID=2582835 RepID=A0ABU4SHM3_9GAMM|nr:hypothetical protein [Xenorhabdus sp. Reich]MDX7998154.1 hypothetical protein [Xenorhabdus sp. Reich]
MVQTPKVQQNLAIDFQGTDVFQGSNLFIMATYTGGTDHKVAETNNIILKADSQNTNVEITKYQDNKRQPIIDVNKNKMVEYFLIKVKNTLNAPNIVLTLTTDITGSISKPLTYTQHQYAKQDINLKSLIPIVIGSTVVEDFSPVADGTDPDKDTHQNLNVSIYPRLKTDVPIKNCQIPLHIEGIKYTRLYNGDTEIFPFNNNMYYVNTDNNGDINLRFFAKKITDGYITKVVISNIMDDITSSLQKNALFITKSISPSDDLEAPIVISIDGDEVPPAGSNKNPTFDARIPRSTILNESDFIYVMSDVDNKTSMLCTSDRYGDRNIQNKPFKIPYKIFTPFQYNSLYYYLITVRGDVSRSKNLAFRVGGDSNSYLPPKGNLELPAIVDYSGDPVDEFFVFGVTSLGTGITCIIPVGGKKEAKVGDTIDCVVEIITYDPDTGNPIPKITKTASVPVTSVSHPIRIPIGSSLLTGFGVDDEGNPTSLYIYYTVNQEKYSQNWQGFLDTVPLDSD